MKALTRIWTLLGSACVVLTLLLSLPGAVRVRADEAQTLSSQDPELIRLAESAELAPPAAAQPAAACGTAADRPPRPSASERMAEHLVRARAAAGEEPVGEGDVIVLNGRGYNYGAGVQPGAIEDARLQRELRLQQQR